MQTPKSRSISVEVPQRTSPATPKTARKLRTPGPDAGSVSSPNPASRTPKDKSPKAVGRPSPRSPAVEQKRPGKVSDYENQLAQLQEEVKAAKDKLSLSESLKKKYEEEADEVKKQLAAMSEKLEESEKKLLQLSYSEEARVLELQRSSQDQDRAWKSELDAVQKQHELDSAALASAMNEIQNLKIQVDRVAGSEAVQARNAESARAEIQRSRVELEETLASVEQLRNQLKKSNESEDSLVEEVSKAQLQLEVTKLTNETLHSEGLKATEAYKSLSLELEQSKVQVAELEELVSKLQSDQANRINVETDELKTELTNLKDEVNQLRDAVEESEKRYHEEYIRSTLQITSAYEIAESTKSESIHREAEWSTKLNNARSDLEELKEKLMNKEAELQKISDENKGLNLEIEEIQTAKGESELEAKLKKSESILADLRESLLDKETGLRSITEENDMLKSEIKKQEMESSKANDEVLALAEAARTAEREALMKLEFLTEAADKSSRKTARVIEELNAAQAANSETEAELRKLKVQSNQWRKAAEAAAAMISTGNNNGKYVERTGSLDCHTIHGKLHSLMSEDMDDDDSVNVDVKKKNGNMLKKISSLLRRGQK